MDNSLDIRTAKELITFVYIKTIVGLTIITLVFLHLLNGLDDDTPP